jgi:phosphoglycolate phosphatase
LDGTLVDTAPDLIGTLNVMLVAEGLRPAPVDAARHLVGSGVRAMLEHGFREAGADLDEARLPGLTDRFIDLYRPRVARDSRPFDGVPEVLDRLAAKGAILCVCTNKQTDLSTALLDQLGLLHRFAAVVGPDRVSARKPSGAHLREAVSLAGGDPARCLMIGDSGADVGAARELGAPVVLVSFGYTPIPAAELGADAVIERFADLEAVAATFFDARRQSARKAPLR